MGQCDIEKGLKNGGVRMSIILSLLLTAADVTSASPFMRDEPTCIVDELDRLTQQQASFKLSDAVDHCRQRFLWTSNDVELALKVTRALVFLRTKRRDAAEAGVNLDVVDKIFDQMKDEQRSSFGWEGEPQPIPDTLNELADRLPASLTVDQRIKAALVILFSAVAHNSINAFIRQRERK